MQGPSFEFENDAFADGATQVAGLDEVGRGPLSGPVLAAAVILDTNNIPAGLNDSKKLSRATRERLSAALFRDAVVCIGQATVEEIDQINILQASFLAMRRAVEGLAVKPDHLLIDGNKKPKWAGAATTCVVKGDARSLSIAAASIVAKVARDEIMESLAQQFPGYGWETNAGYPTKAHKQALESLGVTPHHRRSYKPVHNILYQEKY